MEGPIRAKEERDKKIGEIDDIIKSLLNMIIMGQLNYLNGKNMKENQSDDVQNSLSTVSGEIEERLEKLGAIKKNKDIKYNLKIKFETFRFLRLFYVTS